MVAAPSSNSNDSKFKCFSKTTKVFSPIAKANTVKTIVMDVFNHLNKVELKNPKKGSKTQEWVKKGSSISVIPTSLQSYKDKILNEPPVQASVFKLEKLLNPEQAKRLARTRKQTITAKEKEVKQLDQNIAETERKLATGASKAVSKISKQSVTTKGRKKTTPAKFKSLYKGTFTKENPEQLKKKYKKQVQERNKTIQEIEKLKNEEKVKPNIRFEVKEK